MDQNPYESPREAAWTDADRSPKARGSDWELGFSLAIILLIGAFVSLAASSVAMVRLFF